MGRGLGRMSLSMGMSTRRRESRYVRRCWGNMVGEKEGVGGRIPGGEGEKGWR